MTRISQPVDVDVAILAHNEADTLPRLLHALAQQEVLTDATTRIVVHVLVNGSSDGTIDVARRTISGDPVLTTHVQCHDFEEGGKSRTMERFLRSIRRASSEIVIFMDADIELPDPSTLTKMIAAMHSRPELVAFVSRPVKDIVHHELTVPPAARLIAAGGGTLYDWRKTISGQLFALRGDFAGRLHLPDGLPVEDGFIRAMVLTDFLSGPEKFERIDGDDSVFHVYESIRGAGELLRHQARLVTGGAINSVLFRVIRRECRTADEAVALLADAARTPGWLGDTLARELPRFPHGWVPFSFLTGRLPAPADIPRLRLKRAAVLLAGLGLDLVAWLMASARLARGRGAGHW